MARFVRIPFAFALLGFLFVAQAEDAPPALSRKAPDAQTTDSEPANPRPKRERAISDNVAAQLAARMPKYNPPPKPKPEEEDIDLREVDKPRNNIIRLPKIVVQEERPPVFRERDIHTRQGLAELAMRRYLTPTHRLLNNFYIPFLTASPEQYAMTRYAEDERLANMSDLNDTADTISRTNPREGAYIRRLSNETYMRSGDVSDYRMHNDR
jgi:hypothetical protein